MKGALRFECFPEGERHSLPDPVTLEHLREWIGRWWHDHAVVG